MLRRSKQPLLKRPHQLQSNSAPWRSLHSYAAPARGSVGADSALWWVPVQHWSPSDSLWGPYWRAGNHELQHAGTKNKEWGCKFWKCNSSLLHFLPAINYLPRRRRRRSAAAARPAGSLPPPLRPPTRRSCLWKSPRRCGRFEHRSATNRFIDQWDWKSVWQTAANTQTALSKIDRPFSCIFKIWQCGCVRPFHWTSQWWAPPLHRRSGQRRGCSLHDS